MIYFLLFHIDIEGKCGWIVGGGGGGKGYVAPSPPKLLGGLPPPPLPPPPLPTPMSGSRTCREVHFHARHNSNVRKTLETHRSTGYSDFRQYRYVRLSFGYIIHLHSKEKDIKQTQFSYAFIYKIIENKM